MKRAYRSSRNRYPVMFESISIIQNLFNAPSELNSCETLDGGQRFIAPDDRYDNPDKDLARSPLAVGMFSASDRPPRPHRPSGRSGANPGHGRRRSVALTTGSVEDQIEKKQITSSFIKENRRSTMRKTRLTPLFVMYGSRQREVIQVQLICVAIV